MLIFWKEIQGKKKEMFELEIDVFRYESQKEAMI